MTDFLRGLVYLEILKADFCKIRKIDVGALNRITKLVQLLMQFNERSEKIPSTFYKIGSLEYLDLNHNRIVHLESKVNLTRVNLISNTLQDLH